MENLQRILDNAARFRNELRYNKDDLAALGYWRRAALADLYAALGDDGFADQVRAVEDKPLDDPQYRRKLITNKMSGAQFVLVELEDGWYYESPTDLPEIAGITQALYGETEEELWLR